MKITFSLVEGMTELVESGKAFISDFLRDNTGFNFRQFYGATFSLALFSEKEEDRDLADCCIKEYDLMDKSDSEFHWEFNNYAFHSIIKSQEISKSLESKIRSRLYPLQFKNTPCTNWTLLRSVVKIRHGDHSGVSEARNKLERMQVGSGLIRDDSGVHSFQYHCFSAAMAIEIYDETGEVFFLDSFLNAVVFIERFIFSSGESLMVGRGQNQSFGYGALLYILSRFYVLTKKAKTASLMEVVFQYLKKHQRKNGSFPLVMSGSEREEVQDYCWDNEELAGWYPYNNYFDYLPFMLFFIKKARDVLLKFDNFQSSTFSDLTVYKDRNFIVHKNETYSAVVSKPGGYWTNDLSIPYISVKGEAVTPMLGGEQFQRSLYKDSHLSLPFFPAFKRSLRWMGRFILLGRKLVSVSPLGIMFRSYTFNAQTIEIRTLVLSPFKFEHTYMLGENYHYSAENEHFECAKTGTVVRLNNFVKSSPKPGFSASGRLKMILHTGLYSKFTLEVQ